MIIVEIIYSIPYLTLCSFSRSLISGHWISSWVEDDANYYWLMVSLNCFLWLILQKPKGVFRWLFKFMVVWCADDFNCFWDFSWVYKYRCMSHWMFVNIHACFNGYVPFFLSLLNLILQYPIVFCRKERIWMDLAYACILCCHFLVTWV